MSILMEKDAVKVLRRVAAHIQEEFLYNSRNPAVCEVLQRLGRVVIKELEQPQWVKDFLQTLQRVEQPLEPAVNNPETRVLFQDAKGVRKRLVEYVLARHNNEPY